MQIDDADDARIFFEQLLGRLVGTVVGLVVGRIVVQGLVVNHADAVCLQRFRQPRADVADGILLPLFMIIAA